MKPQIFPESLSGNNGCIAATVRLEADTITALTNVLPGINLETGVQDKNMPTKVVPPFESEPSPRDSSGEIRTARIIDFTLVEAAAKSYAVNLGKDLGEEIGETAVHFLVHSPGDSFLPLTPEAIVQYPILQNAKGLHGRIKRERFESGTGPGKAEFLNPTRPEIMTLLGKLDRNDAPFPRDMDTAAIIYNLWGVARSTENPEEDIATPLRRVDYESIIVPNVKEKTGGNNDFFNQTAIDTVLVPMLLELGPNGKLEINLSNKDFANDYGLTWEEDLSRALNGVRYTYPELGEIVFVNRDAANHSVRPEAARRQLGKEQPRARIEKSGAQTLLVNYYDLAHPFAGTKDKDSWVGLSEGEKNTLIADYIKKALEEYDNIELWVPQNVFYGPNDCGWRAAALKAYEETKLRYPHNDKEIILMNRDLIPAQAEAGWPQRRRLDETVPESLGRNLATTNSNQAISFKDWAKQA